jgi:hypothetical protein
MLEYQLAKPGAAELVIYNLSGRIIRHLTAGQQQADRHRQIWDGRDDLGRAVASGAFWARISTVEENRQQMLMLVR